MARDRVKWRDWLGWRMVLALAGAVVLPLTIYVLITTGINYRDDRIAAERATLVRAQRISDAVDARLMTTVATLRVLATVHSIGEHDWPEASARSREIARLMPEWRDVSLIDTDSGMQLFDLRDGSVSPRRSDRARARALAAAGTERPQFGDITRIAGAPELTATLGVAPAGGGHYLLTVAIDPALIQRVLLADAPRAGVSAVVDRHGLFIARSKAWPQRLGTLATIYVRRAIAQGRGGLYHGTTFEGLDNYAGFATSAMTGWSTHVAVSATLIDDPQFAWRLASLLAALAGLVLAGTLVLLILRLIAIGRATDARARRMERLEAIGQLTGGVAHDFNNMLAIVLGSLDLVKRRLANGKTDDIARHVDNAMDGARRAADLTRRLLAFSRSQPLAPKPVDVNALIGAMGGLLDRTLAGDIAIMLDLAPDLWMTWVDPGLLENAIVNLAVNARDAMPDGGTLTITTANLAASGPLRDRIAITVADTGTGMSAQVLARAFEPFFTTKDVGRGTGLGLSQIHGFATQSGGDATIASQPGMGTAVTITLPRRDTPTAAPHFATHDETAPRGRAEEIILVVEDETAVRGINVAALRELGYSVRHAGGGEQALAMLAQQPGVHLLMSDIVMPGIHGRELAERARALYPGLRVLLVTGFDREEVNDEHRILRKPFGIGELARRVRRELDRPNPF